MVADIWRKKMANEASKAIIRNNMPPHIAEQMCDAIDRHEAAEHFQRLLQEYNEWLVNQQRQQEAVLLSSRALPMSSRA